MNIRSMVLVPAFIIVIFASALRQKKEFNEDNFISYVIDPQKKAIQFYCEDEKQQIFKSILKLKMWLELHNKKLVFAMNGGMYKQNNSPLGLFIENAKRVNVLNTSQGNGNFYLKPNGLQKITHPVFVTQKTLLITIQ